VTASAEGAGSVAGPLAGPPPTDAGLRIDVSEAGGVAAVSLYGALDIATVPTFDQRVDALRRDGHRAVRIDLRDLEFIDSHGLGALLRAWREWGAPDHAIEVVGPRHPQVVRVFAISGADDELRFIPA
jgi:anti-sigma B factor antagonist